MLNLSTKEKRLLMIAIAVILVFCLHAFIVLPIGRAFTGVDAGIRKAELDLVKGRRIVTEKDSVRQEFAQYKQLTGTAGSDNEETAALINEIEQLSDNAGIHVADLGPRAAENKGGYKKYSVDIKITSQIGPLTDFISKLNSSSQVLIVERLRLSPQARPKERGTLDVNMTISRIRLI